MRKILRVVPEDVLDYFGDGVVFEELCYVSRMFFEMKNITR